MRFECAAAPVGRVALCHIGKTGHYTAGGGHGLSDGFAQPLQAAHSLAQEAAFLVGRYGLILGTAASARIPRCLGHGVWIDRPALREHAREHWQLRQRGKLRHGLSFDWRRGFLWLLVFADHTNGLRRANANGSQECFRKTNSLVSPISRLPSEGDCFFGGHGWVGFSRGIGNLFRRSAFHRMFQLVSCGRCCLAVFGCPPAPPGGGSDPAPAPAPAFMAMLTNRMKSASGIGFSPRACRACSAAASWETICVRAAICWPSRSGAPMNLCMAACRIGLSGGNWLSAWAIGPDMPEWARTMASLCRAAICCFMALPLAGLYCVPGVLRSVIVSWACRTW